MTATVSLMYWPGLEWGTTVEVIERNLDEVTFQFNRDGYAVRVALRDDVEKDAGARAEIARCTNYAFEHRLRLDVLGDDD